MFTINKGNNNVWALVVAALILFVLSSYVLVTVDDRVNQASGKGDEKVAVYDLDKIMSYYIDSINDGNTMIYAHYNSDSGEVEEVTCLSCHDINLLRKLYFYVDALMLDEAINVGDHSETTLMCLACLGSYEELAQLTADYTGLEDELGNIANPHVYGGGIADTSTEERHYALPCLQCHTFVHNVSDVLFDTFWHCSGCHHERVFECGTCHVMSTEDEE